MIIASSHKNPLFMKDVSKLKITIELEFWMLIEVIVGFRGGKKTITSVAFIQKVDITDRI